MASSVASVVARAAESTVRVMSCPPGRHHRAAILPADYLAGRLALQVRRLEVETLLQTNTEKEQLEPGARGDRRTPVPGEHRDDRVEHPWRRIVAEEEITECRGIERDDE